MSRTEVLNVRPSWHQAGLKVPPKAWGQYSQPCQIIRLECHNLRMRGEGELDFLLVDCLQLANSLGHINAPTIQRVLGVGFALARVVMRMLWVRGLIEETTGNIRDPLANYEGFLFDDDIEPRADIENRYDAWHTLSEEGLRVVDTGEFEPLELTDRVLYFLEPCGEMLPLDIQLPENLDWKQASGKDLATEKIAAWFQPGERENRRVPDQVYGPVLEETKVFDDYGEELEPLPPTTIKASTCIPSENGIWFINWLGGPLTDNPARAEIIREGYWYAGTWHSVIEAPTGKGWAKIPSGKVGKTWKLNPVKGQTQEVKATRLVVESTRFLIEIENNKPPNEWLPTSHEIIPEVIVSGVHQRTKEALLRLVATPLPSKQFVEDWVHQASEQIAFPNNQVLTQDHVEASLEDLKALLNYSWLIEGTQRASWNKQYLNSILEAEAFVQRRFKQGDWLLRYRLDEQEVFADAL